MEPTPQRHSEAPASPCGSGYGMELSSRKKPWRIWKSTRVSNVLSLAGLIISGVVVILFVADLAVAFPFQRTSVAADIGFILAGLLVAYLSWSINPRARA